LESFWEYGKFGPLFHEISCALSKIIFFRVELDKHLPQKRLWMHSNTASRVAPKTSKEQAENF
jgi:hypothetical protein